MKMMKSGILGVTVATLALGFSSGCLPKTESGTIEAIQAKNTELENAVKMLTAQLRTLNEEHVTMKKLVSDMSDSVLHQTSEIDKLNASMKQVTDRPAAPARPVRKAAAPVKRAVIKAPAKAPAPRAKPKPAPTRRR